LQLTATNARAQELLQQRGPELRALLESRGLPTAQIDVQLRPELRQDFTPHQQQGQGWAQPGGQGQPQGFNQEGRQPAPGQQPDMNPPGSAAAEPGETGWRELQFATLDVTA
jgi:flagellar hook-length control protein FliK